MGKAWRSYCRGCLYVFAFALAATGAVLAFFATLRYDGILMDNMFETVCHVNDSRIDSHFGNPPSHYRAIFSVSFKNPHHHHLHKTSGIAAVGSYHVVDRGRLLKDSLREQKRYPVGSSSACLIPEDDSVMFDDSEGIQGFRMGLLNTTFAVRAELIREFSGLVTGAVLSLSIATIFCFLVVRLRKVEKRYCCDDYFIGRREIRTQSQREKRRQKVKATWDDPLHSSWKMLVDDDQQEHLFQREIADLDSTAGSSSTSIQ